MEVQMNGTLRYREQSPSNEGPSTVPTTERLNLEVTYLVCQFPSKYRGQEQTNYK